MALEDSFDDWQDVLLDEEFQSQLSFYQIKHHLGTPLVELLPGSAVHPRILSLLCQLLIDNQFVQPDLFNQKATPLLYFLAHLVIPFSLFWFRYQTFRSQIDIGDLADCADTVVVCNALIDFVRELPEPLIPYQFYDRAITIVKEFMIESALFRDFRSHADPYIARINRGGGGSSVCA